MFFLFFLLFNCVSIYFFRKWLGPVGLYCFSSLFIIITICGIAFVFFKQLSFGNYYFFDAGRIFYIYDFFDMNFIFISDSLSTTTSLLVLTLTLFAQFFGVEYMYREAFIMRLLYLLIFFATSVVFLFYVYDFFLVLVVWELIGLFSLLLVNFYSVRIYTIKAAFKTFIFSRLSDFFIFIAFFLIVVSVGSTDFSILFIQIPFFMFYNVYIFNLGFNFLNILTLCLVFAGAIKAAQFPFHVWLPDAMEAPTPASALIHSSTLVIMGIYLIIRFSIIFEFSYFSNLVLMLMGGLTITIGAVSASFQNDIKKLVAYSTVSQMGYLFCGCGFLAYTEVLFYLTVHALNKAFLFIMVGYIVHFFNGNTDMRFMGNLYPYAPDIVFILIVISLNLSGLPLTSGFLSKEFLIFQTFKDDYASLVTRVFWFFSFVLTPFYMFFLNWFVLFKLKQNFVKLYVYNKPLTAVNFKPLTSLFKLPLIFSSLFSKPTTLVLFSLLSLILFTGEFCLFILFNSLNLLEVNLSSVLLESNLTPFLANSLFSCSLVSTLNIVILTSCAASARYLWNLVN